MKLPVVIVVAVVGTLFVGGSLLVNTQRLAVHADVVPQGTIAPTSTPSPTPTVMVEPVTPSSKSPHTPVVTGGTGIGIVEPPASTAPTPVPAPEATPTTTPVPTPDATPIPVGHIVSTGVSCLYLTSVLHEINPTNCD